MKRQRAVAALLTGVGIVATWLVMELMLGGDFWSLGALGQVGRLPPGSSNVPTKPEGKPEPVRLPRDRNAERKITEAQRLIKEKEWRQAIELLQGMLDEKEDRFMQDSQGRWASVRSEANRLLASMGREGLQHYEQYYGAQARASLQQALQSGDVHKLAEVAVRFLYTEAGAEALAALGTMQLDQGSAITAALYFERLLKRVGSLAELPTLTLVKAAFAFERAGQTSLRDQVWEELSRRDWQRDLPAGLARLSPKELRQLAAASAGGRFQRERFDWPIFGGDLQHTAISEGTAPFLETAYELPTYRDPRTRTEIEAATRALERRGVVLPGGLPASFGDMVLFRTSHGLQAIRASTGEVLWRSAEYEYNLDNLLASGGRPPEVYNLINQYKNSGPRAFVYNTLLGTVSVDSDRAYIVEDTPLPPIVFRRNMPVFMPGGLPPSIGSSAHGNNLTAVYLDGGRLAWSLEVAKLGANSPLADTFFLGPPLPLGGKLYILAESNGEIRLVCLEPSTGAVNWVQPLCFVERRVLEEPERRMEACHLAYSDGILVCPTNAGIVLGVDLLSRSLVWAQPYDSLLTRVDDPSNFPRQVAVRQSGVLQLMEPRWYYSAPMIAQGKVVFTAPDTKYLYCLNLQDGTNAWGPIPQEAGDLYVAGIYHGRVVVVSRDRVRALDLADGKLVWRVSVPMPAGRGVANASTYFLPTRTGEVLAISLQDGAILGRSLSPKKEPLGNLLFHNGYVLVQGTTSLVAYPQLAVRQAEIAQTLQKNPKDPFALTERGVLRLHWGEIDNAVADLRLALEQEMPYELRRRAQQKLFDALTIRLYRDFAAHEHDLAEYERLVAIPEPPNESPEAQTARLAEQRQRRAVFLYLTARGREAQGRFRDAFQAYLEFGKLGNHAAVTLPGDVGGNVLPEQLAESRLLALLERPIPPEQRRAILDLVEQEWQNVRTSASLEALQRFIHLMGEIGESGVQARLLLAERYVSAGKFADAEYTLLTLLSHPDETAAARGLEALAQLHARNGNMETALFYFTRLAELFPDIPVRDGKTGRQILDELATDKRFLPFLDAGKQTWLPSRPEIRYRIESGTFPQMVAIRLDTSEVRWPSMQRYALAIAINQFPNQLRIYERGRGDDASQVLRSLPLEHRSVSVNIHAQNFFQATRCQGVGSLIFFTWGSHLYALDLNEKKFAWKRDLLSEIMQNWPPGVQPNLYWDPSVNDWTVNYPDGTRERLFTQFLATTHYVAYFVKDRGLIVAEPRTGSVLWEKRLASAPAELFGDERVIGLVIRGEGGSGQHQTLVFSAKSGEVLTVPDFLPAWQQRKHILGRYLLLCEAQPNNQENWRLYDVVSGRNVWSRRLHNVLGQAQSLVPGILARLALAPRAANDDRAGELAPHLLILDMRTGRTLASCEIPEGAVLQQSECYLLADDFHWYLVYNKTNRAFVGGGVLAFGNGRQLFPQGTMMRTLLVEGPLLAWDRVSGQLRWKTELPLQTLILERLEEMPLLLCASWQRTPLDNVGRRVMDINLVHAVDKRNGKLTECETAMRSQFHELLADRVRGTVELRSGNFRIVFEVADPQETAQGGASRSDASAEPGAPPARPAVPNPPIRVIQPAPAVPVLPLPIAPAQPVPKIQIQPLPVPIAPPAQDAPAPAVPKIIPPAQQVPAKAAPAPLPPKAQQEEQGDALEQEIRQLRNKLQEMIREFNNDGPGIDREKFERIQELIQELRRLQEERSRQLQKVPQHRAPQRPE
ncbi:MAG: PQQ-binding-like beta-propeller repeat protein [Gemmatales bacterium]|nr:PQQ-binding-like beta-propeller repeat protein [Gemmatales bacterium]